MSNHRTPRPPAPLPQLQAGASHPPLMCPRCSAPRVQVPVQYVWAYRCGGTYALDILTLSDERHRWNPVNPCGVGAEESQRVFQQAAEGHEHHPNCPHAEQPVGDPTKIAPYVGEKVLNPILEVQLAKGHLEEAVKAFRRARTSAADFIDATAVGIEELIDTAIRGIDAWEPQLLRGSSE